MLAQNARDSRYSLKNATVRRNRLSAAAARVLGKTACSAAILAMAGSAIAQNYDPTISPSTIWSDGTGWDSIPSSNLNTALVFGPLFDYPDFTPISNVNTNDFGAFTLNSMTFQGTAPFSAGFNVSVQVTGGTLNFVNNGGAVGPKINFDAFNSGSTVSYTISSGISMGNTLTLAGEGSGVFLIDGVISGASTSNLVKTGGSAVTLAGANTYSGATLIQGGALKINAANNLGDGSGTNTITLSGNGTLQSTGNSYSLGRAVTMAGDGSIQSDSGTLTLDSTVNLGANTLTLTGAGNTAITGVVSGATGSLVKTGNGTLTLSGANTYGGATIVNAGTLAYGASNVIGSGAVTVSGINAVLALGANQSDSVGLVTVSGGGSITGSGTSTLTSSVNFDLQDGSVSAILAGATAGVGVSKTGFGNVLLTGANTYSGVTDIQGGVLSIAGAAALGNNSATNTITIGNFGVLRSAGNTYSLGTNRVITLTGQGGVQTDLNTFTVDGAVHTAGNTFTVGGVAAGSTIISGVIDGSGGLLKTGNGTLTLSAANTYSGTSEIAGGLVRINAANNLGNGSGTNGVVLSGGALNVISGTFNLGRTVSVTTAGTIQVDTGAALTLDGAVGFTSAGVLTIQGAGNTIITGNITDSGFGGGLTKNGVGNLTLSSPVANDFTGLTNILGGSVIYTLNNQLGSGPVTVNGTAAILDLGTSHTDTVGTVTLDGGANINGTTSSLISTGTFELKSGTVAAGVNLGGAVALNKTTGGTVTLSGANGYSGATTISGGVLRISAANNLGDGSATNSIVLAGGTLQSTANIYDLGVNRAISLTAPSTIQVDAGTLTVSGAVTNGANQLTVTGAGNTILSGVIGNGAGGLQKLLAGTLTVSGVNTYTGVTTINAGTVIAANPQAFGLSPASLLINGNGVTLNLATDTSINAYPLSITGANTIILSNKATAASAGITHTLGALTMNGQQITISAGTNVSGGTPEVVFGNATLGGGQDIFIPTTAAVKIGTVTAASGSNPNILLQGTSLGDNRIGALNQGSGQLQKTTTATWTFTGTGSYTGTTSLTSGISKIAADNPFGLTGAVTFQGPAVIMSDSSAARAIANPVLLTRGTNEVIGTVAGTGNITFNGLLTNNSNAGDRFFVVNNTGLTTLHGGLRLSPNDNRELSLRGTGNILIDSAITPAPAGTATNIVRFLGANTVTLSAPGFMGGDNAASGVSLFVASGAAPDITGGTGGVQGNTGNTVLKIAGNYTMGNAGIMTVTVRGGNGTTTTQGTISLVDGAPNTLTINSTAAAPANVLTMGAGSGLPSVLNLEVGSTADKIALGAGHRAVINAGGVLVNITGIGNLNGVTQDLVTTANTSAFTTGNFTLNSSVGNFSGYTVSLDYSVVGKLRLIETPTFVNPTLATAYWVGGQTGTNLTGFWNAFTGGNANNSNWATDATGATDTHYAPVATTDVFFSSAIGTNTTTTLGGDFSIKSLTFTNVGGGVSVGGSNTLTVGTGGITMQTGAPAASISAPVIIGSAQSWTNNSVNDLTVNGAVTSTTGITKAGNGTLVLGGTNTGLTGGLLINAGAVRIGSTGALNATTPQAVTFGASVPSTAKLQTNGNSFTIGGLSTNATPGSPIVENANAAAATLTIAPATTFTYAGVIQNGTGGGALSIVKSGVGTQILSGANSYTGTTTVNNGVLLITGNSSAANGAVTVQTLGVLGGTGTVGGATTIGSGGRITGADLTTVGTLNLSSGLSINTGGIGYFNINNGGTNDTVALGGGLTLASGSIIRVTGALTAGATYNLITYTGADPTVNGVVTLQDLGGNNLPSTYAFSASGGVLRLVVTAGNYASPTISIATPVGGSRVMSNQNVAMSGTVGNTGNLSLNAALSDNGGNMTVSGFTPSNPTVAAGGSTGYTASIATGSTLGNRTFSVKVTGSPSDPSTATASSNLTVLANRTVSVAPTSVDLGYVHVNAPKTVTGGVSLTSTQPDDQYTRVTVANGTNGSVTVSGGNPATVFNGTNSDTRDITGNFSGFGAQSGTLVLTTTGEGLAGEVTNNVSIGYTANVYSGKASYSGLVSGNWGVASNWDDLNPANLGGDGAPGLDGAFSAGDAATFTDVFGQTPGTLTVSLNGVSPSLAAMTFNGLAVSYTIATGTGGTITLQGAATPIDVVGTHRIGAVLTGTGGGMKKTGSGTLIISGAATYTGATNIANGIVQVDVANALPTTTSVVLGDATSNTSGKLILGSTSGTRAQTIAGLTVAGLGADNRVVGGNSGTSTLTVSIASGVNTYTGFLGGTNTNENNLALTKTGAGTLVLTQAPTYVGTTTISRGVLQTASANDLPNFVSIIGGDSLTTTAVWQTQGVITKNIGGSGAGNIAINNGGGFSAAGGPLTVTLNGGAQVTYQSSNFLNNTGFVFGSTTSDNQVEFTNAINLNTGDGFLRTFYVEASTNPNASALLSGVISPGTGTTGFAKKGGGVLIMSNINTWSGATAINDGFLVAMNNAPSGAPGAFGNATSTIQVGDGGGSGSSNTAAGSTGVGVYIKGGDFTVGRNFNVSAQANNANPTVIFGGLTDNQMAFTGNIASVQNFKITQVATTGVNKLTVSGNLTAAGKTITFDNVGEVLFSGVASGTVNVAKTNSGNLTITGANTYSGTTLISSGNVIVGDGGSTGALGTGAITNNTSLAFNRSDAALIVAAAIGGTGTLTQQGSGTTTLTGTNNYSGLTTIAAGTLQIGNNGTTGSLGTAGVTNNAALILNRSNAYTVSNVISGSGTLEKKGTGTTILTGANNYGGITTVTNGTLQVGDGTTVGSLGTGAVVTNATLAFNRSDAVTVTNGISGTGAVTNNGTGTLNLNGTQSYATLNTNAGTTNVNSTFTAPATVNANAGALTFSSNQTLTALNIGAGATVTFQDAPSFSEFAGPTTAAVPEPGTMGLLVVGALGMLARRRRKA